MFKKLEYLISWKLHQHESRSSEKFVDDYTRIAGGVVFVVVGV